jgi:hypothetical protein
LFCLWSVKKIAIEACYVIIQESQKSDIFFSR